MPSTISVVIPAKNEVGNIERTLMGVMNVLPGNALSDVIVVDNGSSDETANIAAKLGAKVVNSPEGTIGTLRNRGVHAASGDVILFLDADIELLPSWQDDLDQLFGRTLTDPPEVIGSVPLVPESFGWVPKAWRGRPRGQKNVRHVGSGLMLMSKDLFHRVGGFDETLQTGEDYELCSRIRAAGGRIVQEPALTAVHWGEPNSVRDFFRREMWHGVGDTETWKAVFMSRVQLLALVALAGHGMVLAGAIFWEHLLITALLIAAGPSILVSIRRGWTGSAVGFVKSWYLSYLYLWARAFSFVGRVRTLKGHR